MNIQILLYIGILGFQNVRGHGAMYYPSPWHATSDCTPDMSPDDCKFELKIPNNCTGRCSKSTGYLKAWFTNHTLIPGDPILPEDMYDPWEKLSDRLHPWSAPGTAPIVGNGCGVNGGNPNGCDGEENILGRCCGGGCGGYVGGKPALDHYHDGLFGNPKVTTWTRGQPAEVYWQSGARHRGGYAYRLCKVNNGKIWKVTEECFQKGHLDFAGKTTWIYWQPNNQYFNPSGWLPIDLVTTKIGTNPKGSEWAKVNLPKKPERDDEWAFKDLVEVPESLEPGEYVLSFRWDCQHTSQVWNACANIEIV